MTYSHCRKHPTYQAIKHPRTACKTCWYMWLRQNPEAPITAKHLFKLMLALEAESK